MTPWGRHPHLGPSTEAMGSREEEPAGPPSAVAMGVRVGMPSQEGVPGKRACGAGQTVS